MKIHTVEMSVRTSGKGTYEITDKVTEIIKASGISSGQVSVFVCHTSCSLVVMENADPSARTDLHAFFDRLVPEDTPYFIHTYEGPDDMPSHIRMCLTDVEKTIPILQGAMVLGAWQGIFVFEHRHAAQDRRLVVNVLGK